jgi:hypothetical protein
MFSYVLFQFLDITKMVPIDENTPRTIRIYATTHAYMLHPPVTVQFTTYTDMMKTTTFTKTASIIVVLNVFLMMTVIIMDTNNMRYPSEKSFACGEILSLARARNSSDFTISI